MQKKYICFLLQLCALTVSENTGIDSPEAIRLLHQVFRWFSQTYGRVQVRKYTGPGGKVQGEIPPDVPFPCNVTDGRSSKVPDSVHRLRPGDIDVIAAMGDSLTAGNGIFGSFSPIEIVVPNRGIAGAGGGEGTWRNYLTLPNILKEFNSKLIGYAYGDSVTSDPASQLNVALHGSISSDMPFMAKFLINKMKNDPRINMKKHWKLITIHIGCNDFCSELCETSTPKSLLEKHKNDLINAIRILRDNIPRAFVGIVPPPYLKELVDCRMRKGKETFDLCYTTSNFECPCLFGLQYLDRRTEYYEIMKKWQNIDKEIIDYSEFHRDDFTAVILPSLHNTTISLTKNGLCDETFFSIDCFHLSQKSNAYYANGLWNNLLEPYSNKTDHWTYPLYGRFLCPTPEKPFLTTRENSRSYS